MSHPLSVVDGYDAWARHYDAEDNPLVLLESRVVVPLLPDLRGKRVLDLGCGTGRCSLAMTQQGADVTAVDFSRKMLAAAAAKSQQASLTFLCHDLARPLPFDRGSFDLVTCHLVTDHIEDLMALFREMRRICNEAGSVINTNMHPAMHLLDVTARFVDPTTGQRIPIETSVHTVSEYLMAVIEAGLSIDHFREHAYDSELARHAPRSQRYVGWPMLMVIRSHPA